MVTIHRDTVRRLTKARKMAGLSSRQLSMLAGVAENFSAIIERGKAKAPSFGVISGFARVLGVSLDWLDRGQGPEPTREQIVAAVEAAQKARAA